METIPIIKISSKPEALKDLLFNNDRIIVEIDSVENDYTRTCAIGDRLLIEPDKPTRRGVRPFVVGIGDSIICCKVMQSSRKRNILTILGMGDVPISDIVIWCSVKWKNPKRL